uniref:Type III endosome membrane protein TEMP n=1 Tax=Pogona vitticeps TaxID=103695 RepID=A0A6J0SYP9_9SAUR
MKDTWCLQISSMFLAWSVVSGHPCNIDEHGWAACSGKNLLHVPNTLPRDITNLDLSFNSLIMPRHGTFLSSFPLLHSLNLSSNTIPTLYPWLFCNLETLQILDISNCSISHVHRNSFRGLKNLHTLLLKNNKLQFLDFSIFSASRALVHLDLQNNELPYTEELAMFAVQRRCHINLRGNLWVYKGSSTPFQQVHREDKQTLPVSHLELQVQEIRMLDFQDLGQKGKLRVPRDEGSAPSQASTENGTLTATPLPVKTGRSWPYFAGFVLLAIGISIVVALVAKCKLMQRNRTSYQHQRLPDSRSLGSTHAEEVDVEVAYARNQMMGGAVACLPEDDDGFIEDNYIEPNRDLQEEEEEEEMETGKEEPEPHFKL